MDAWDEFHKWLDDGQPGGIGAHTHRYHNGRCAVCLRECIASDVRHAQARRGGGV